MTERTHKTQVARRRRNRAPKLRQLTFHPRGGHRPGAGRKPKGPRALVSHKTRSPLAPRFPVLVTTRVLAGLPSLRRGNALEVLTTAIRACHARADQHGLRIVHFSIQTNHLHFLVEARHAQSLSRGLQGLFVRMARGLNRLWKRKGSLFADRYHARILRTPREVRNALAYLLHNARKHGCHVAGVDPFASGSRFDGWKQAPLARDACRAADRAPPVLPARTWLLARGWRRHGLIELDEVPGRAQRATSSAGASTKPLDLDGLRRAARQPTS